MKQPAVYLMASQRNGTLYAGVTSNLIQRVWQHKNHVVDGFTKKYKVELLVWFEQHENMESAIAREKAIKKWNREWKLNLIEKTNPDWQDLWPMITGEALDSRLRGNDDATDFGDDAGVLGMKSPVTHSLPALSRQPTSAVPAQANTQAVIPAQAGIQTAIPAQANTQAVIPAQAGIQTAVPAQANTQAVIPAQAGIQTAVPTQANTQAVIPAQAGIQTAVPAQANTQAVIPAQAGIQKDTQ
jgi:putative endonuclease